MRIVQVEEKDFKLVFGSNAVKDTNSSDLFYLIEDVAGVVVQTITGETSFYGMKNLHDFTDEDMMKVLYIISPIIDKTGRVEAFNYVTGERFTSDKEIWTPHTEELLANVKRKRLRVFRIATSLLVPLLFAIVVGLILIWKG